MSRTISSYAAKLCSEATAKLMPHNAERFSDVELPIRRRLKASRRRRRLYAEARKAKVVLDPAIRPSHDDAGDMAGFTCLYG